MNNLEEDLNPDNDLGELSVDWKSVPSLSDLKSDYKEAIPYHDEQMNKVQKWLDNFYVENGAIPKTGKDRSKVVPKLIRKQAEWRFAPLSEPFLSSQDLFQVNPTEHSDVKAAEQNKLILNYQFNNDIDKVAFFDKFVRAIVVEGTVLVFVGWEYEAEDYVEPEPEFELIPDLTFEETLAELIDMKDRYPDNYEEKIPYELKGAVQAYEEEGLIARPKIVGYVNVKKVHIIKNRPKLEVMDLENTILDPTANGDLSKINFFVRSFESSLTELTKDGRYFNLDKLEITGSSLIEDAHHISNWGEGNFNYKDNARKKFIVREYWGYRDINADNKVVPIVAAWVNDTLIRLEESPFPDKKLPIEGAVYLPVRNSLYGEPDGELLADNQSIISAVTRGMIDTLGRSANGQTGIRMDLLDPINRKKFNDGNNYEFNSTVDPRQGMFQHVYPEFPQSAQYMLQLQNADAESLSGVKAFSGGLSGDAFGKVATNTRGVLDAASKREVAILRRLSECIVRIGKKIVSMNAEFLSEREVIRVTNEKFVEIRRTDLKSTAGKFDLQLEVTTAEEDNAKAEELAYMLQTLGNNIDQGITKMIQVEIAKLRKLVGLAKRLEEYEPKPDPLEEQIKQLQLQKLQAEIEEIQSRVMENRSDAELNIAKASTEGAKVSNLDSQTTRNSLDFIQEESGVNQERELESQGAQARANMDLKAFERNLDREDANAAQSKEDIDKFLKTYMSGSNSNNQKVDTLNN